MDLRPKDFNLGAILGERGTSSTSAIGRPPPMAAPVLPAPREDAKTKKSPAGASAPMDQPW